MCRSVKVSSYGIVECITLAAQVTQTSVQLSVNGNAFLCQGINGACDYQTSDSMPVVESLVKQDANTLVFTGIGFEFLSFPAEVTYMGIDADTVTVDSDT